MAVLHHDGRAVGLVQRQFFEASGQRPARPSARIGGLALLELRMPGRLAVADLIRGGCRLGGCHDGGSRGKRDGTVQRRENRRTMVIWSTLQQVFGHGAPQEAKYKYTTPEGLSQ